ncbi:LysR family transcriptional regulator [Paucibacter sp. KCTC 42545]|uniref:LysR family transcriptional regulator n=1 Tax=Paucibacter sp. KCTC 42545 TaxID=1768242 RepID=UPI000733B30B|nr:LysR family transcriptional regulator [Paucibacter sp. KCTC 42545]ALT79354.1 LysR family transcriptional regulator [Paucibacter sp. KCTC 42545]
MDRLRAMQLFVEVVERGSLTAAAEHLQMSRAMASRHLEALEQWLGARLLQRSTRRLSLTEAGTQALSSCRQMVALADETLLAAGNHQQTVQGQLRVSASASFAQGPLAPAVVDFLRQHPQTRIEVLVQERAVNLVEDRIDLALRISNQLDPQLIARRLTWCRSAICAAPAYLAAQGQPQSPADLMDHACMAHQLYSPDAWRLQRGGERVVASLPQIRLSANDSVTLLRAALAGGGIALLPTYLAGPFLASGELQRVLPEHEPECLGLHAVYTSRRYQPALLRSFIDFLAQRFDAELPFWDVGAN